MRGHGTVERDSPNGNGDEVREQNSEQTSYRGDDQGFSKELEEDVAPAGTQGFLDTDFASALSNGDQHHIGETDAADPQGERPNKREKNFQS